MPADEEGAHEAHLCTAMRRWGTNWQTRRPVYRPCGNRAKGFLSDGRPACGIHLAQQARRERPQDRGVGSDDHG